MAPVHCTGEPAFAALMQSFGDRYVYAGLGTTLELGPEVTTKTTLVLFPTDNCGSVVAGAFLARRSPPGMVAPLPRAATPSGARPRPPEGRAHKRTSAALRSLTVSRYAFAIAPCICTLVGTLIHNYQLERALVSELPAIVSPGPAQRAAPPTPPRACAPSSRSGLTPRTIDKI